MCAATPPRVAHCLADVVTNAAGAPLASAATLPPGYGPADLQNAYNLASAVAAGSGSGKTVAIVDAYHDPNAEADLGVYRQTYGLTPCTTQNGCLHQVNQNGSSSSYPATNGGWSQEISLDLDMVSAVCPCCHILLVEANSSYMSDLGTAVNTAARLGASAISNSYGGGEYWSETIDESRYYNHPGISVTVSSGDNGYGVEFPAASQYVTAVGGTSLSKTTGSTRGWAEVAWSGAGSGCSAYEPKPAWQSTPAGCSHRVVADVSADADPNTGVAVYDSLAIRLLGMDGVRRDERVVADCGRRRCSVKHASGPGFPVRESVAVLRRGRRPKRHVLDHLPVQCVAGYDGPTGIGTPNGAGAGGAPAAPPQNTALPTITGSPVLGQTLTATTGTWTNSPTTYSYAWQSCSSGGACSPVGGNASTYQLVSSDVGHTIKVTVGARNSAGGPVYATSTATAPVAGGQADFTVSAPSTASVRRTTTAQLSVTVNPVNGFASPTTMSVSGLPLGVSPTWSVNPATPGTPTTLRLRATLFSRVGTFTITIKGAAGTLSHTTTTKLTVT